MSYFSPCDPEYKKLAELFLDCFGVNLGLYYSERTGFDNVAFDSDILKSAHANRSYRSSFIARAGHRGRELLVQLNEPVKVPPAENERRPLTALKHLYQAELNLDRAMEAFDQPMLRGHIVVARQRIRLVAESISRQAGADTRRVISEGQKDG